MNKIWETSSKISKKFKDKFSDIHPIVLQILFNRGLKSKKEIKNFLFPDYQNGLFSPFLFNDMKKAVNRIFKAYKNKEKVFICTDSDTDGATAGALMFKTLKKIGIDSLDVYSVDRDKDGYGLSDSILKKQIRKKTNLIITCDSGISNYDEIQKAQAKGIDVIVTDHHQEPKELPPAFAILNPKVKKDNYPFKYLAGVGVAFKLAQALLSDKRFDIKNRKAFEKWLLDLVAIGTIVDRMPIIGENRNLVYFGMKVVNKTLNLGIRQLLENVNLDLGSITARDISFRVGPRLNVPGRIGHSNESLKLLISHNILKAKQRVKRIEDLNKKRRDLVQNCLIEIIKEIGKNPQEKILVVEKDLKSGLLGLIAMRLVEKYNRPVIVLSFKKDIVKGSGRSIKGFNFLKAIKSINQKYFVDLGGHKQALGFTLKPKFLKNFKNDIQTIEKLLTKKEKSKLKIDTKIKLGDINWDLVDNLKNIRPFGVGNPRPLFITKNLHLSNFVKVGKNGKHNRLMVKDRSNGDFSKMIYFRSSKVMKDYNKGDKVDIVYHLGTNVWNGQKEIQMTVIDIK